MTRTSYRDARSVLAAAQKPAAGVPAYLRWVNRPLGGQAAIVAAAWGWSPNGVTALSAGLSLSGVVVLAVFPVWWAGVVAAALLLVGYVLDSADGQLARIQRRGGPAGEWLDHVVDAARAPLVHIAVATHLLRTDAPELMPLVAGLFSVLVSAWFLSQLLAEKLLPRPSHSADSSRPGIMESFVKQPQDPSTTYALIAVIGIPGLFAVLYLCLFAWQLLIFAGSLQRKYAQLKAL